MGKPVQRNRYKNKKNITCDMCTHCIYVEEGDMYCDLTVDSLKKEVKWIYEEFIPTEDYMWCNKRKYDER